MSNDQFTPGWKAAIVVSLVLSAVAVGLSLFRGDAASSLQGYDGQISALENRIKAIQMQPAKAGARPDDRSLGE